MNISNVEIGKRLRVARENASITQMKAASLIGVARTTVVAIEKGDREIHIDELQILAKAYNVSSNEILRNETISINILPSFRKSNDTKDNDVYAAVNLLKTLFTSEIELENTLGVKKPIAYLRPTSISYKTKDSIKESAYQDVIKIRTKFGIKGTSFDILSLLDTQIGIRIYLRPLHGKISGVYVYDQKLGACILINSTHPASRQRFTLAHEFGHFMVKRDTSNIFYDKKEKSISKEEFYADTFAKEILMPRKELYLAFKDITAGQSHLTRRHIIILSDMFKVSREAIVKRLEELSIAKKGTWDWFVENGGITDVQFENVLGRKPERYLNELDSIGILPIRLILLVCEAYKNDLYTEGQLSKMFNIDRLAMREILELAGVEEGSNELFRL